MRRELEEPNRAPRGALAAHHLAAMRGQRPFVSRFGQLRFGSQNLAAWQSVCSPMLSSTVGVSLACQFRPRSLIDMLRGQQDEKTYCLVPSGVWLELKVA